MTEISGALLAIGAFLTILGTLGIAFGVLRAKGVKETIEILTLSNTELRSQMDHDRDECDRRLHALEQRATATEQKNLLEIGQLKGQIKLLQDGLVTDIVTTVRDAIVEAVREGVVTAVKEGLKQ